MSENLTEAQWARYERDGFLKLGKLLTDEDLLSLQKQIDDIMLGKAEVDYGRMLMQEDSSDGAYHSAGSQTKGHKGSHLNYRKIQDLEYADPFLRYMQRPLFRSICEKVYGNGVPVGCFRAMFFNKPARMGTYLPWHQDRWNYLDRDPLVTIWTAMDPATVANGCVKLIPGSHKRGLINPSHGSGFLTPEQAREHCLEKEIFYLELEPGEVALLHNWTLHSSDVNSTDISRRAFSTCYLDGRTLTARGGTFPILFGEGALAPRKSAPTAAP